MDQIDENKNRHVNFFKKYLPITALVCLTIILMIVFKNSKREIGQFIEKGKNNLVSFYANNLKPLFATTNISNEDVFNFAVYQNIPIDKEKNKILSVTYQDKDNQVYEIKPATYNVQTDNYQKFQDYLNLDGKEKQEADSILNYYKRDIYLSVLMNDNNAVAISSKIGQLQKAILASLVSFAQKVNANKANELFESKNYVINNAGINKFIASVREEPEKEYVIITPDTVFKTICKIDEKNIKKDLDKKLKIWEPGIPDAPGTPKIPKNWSTDFRFSQESKNSMRRYTSEAASVAHVFKPDSHFFKVVVPFPKIPSVPFVNDSVRSELEKTAARLRKLSINFGNKSRINRYNFKEKHKRIADSTGIELYFQNPTEIVNQTMKLLSKNNFNDWEEFGEKMDSFAKTFSAVYADSVINKALIEKQKELNRREYKAPTPKKEQ